MALLFQNKEFPEKGNPAAGLYNTNVGSCWPHGISYTGYFFFLQDATRMLMKTTHGRPQDKPQCLLKSALLWSGA